MKKMITTFVTGVFLGAMFLTLCGQNISIPDLHRLPDYYLQPVQGLPQNDSSSGNEAFRRKALISLRNNEKMLIDLNEKIDCSNKQVKAKYLSLLVELQNRNASLKNRLYEHKLRGKPNNRVAFEHIYTEDMNQLTRTIINFHISNEVMI